MTETEMFLEKWTALKNLVESAEGDADKVSRGQSAAGVRLRKAMRELRKATKELGKSSLAVSKSAKEARKSG